MQILEVRKITSNKVRIALEDGSSFVLYAGEAARYHIAENGELSDETLRLIYDEILEKRAKKRCLYLLKDMDRTEGQLRERLQRDGYPESIIQSALAYAASYHYTDDRRYVRNYIDQMKGRKSLRMIGFDLMRKGVDRSLIDEALEQTTCQEEEDPDLQAILRLAEKRHYHPDTADSRETDRLMRYLMGKGFTPDSVRRALRCMQEAQQDSETSGFHDVSETGTKLFR